MPPSGSKIALLGTGLMGGPMAGRIAEAGYPLIVWNRTGEKAMGVKKFGAAVAKTPVEAVSGAACIVLMLADHPAIEEVLFTGDTAASLSEKTFLQMGTISPAQSVSLEKELEKRGADYFEAPVLGSIPEAAAGKLLVMVGGTEQLFHRWSGLLECFGPEPLFIGGKLFLAQQPNSCCAALTPPA